MGGSSQYPMHTPCTCMESYWKFRSGGVSEYKVWSKTGSGEGREARGCMDFFLDEHTSGEPSLFFVK